MARSGLRLVKVWKAFERGRERVSVLENVSLEVDRGEIAAVVGGRDQGKTTLVRIASGMLHVDRGSVFVGDRDLSGTSERQLADVLGNEIGVATRIGPEARLRVRDYVVMSLTPARRYGRRERASRVADTLDRLDLTSCGEAEWAELSNWQRVRVELAQAVVGSPQLLLVDDLVDGLSLAHKKTAMRLLEDLVSELHCAVLMAVSDHAAALGSTKVWSLDHAELELMHSETPGIVELDERRRG